MIDWSKLYSGNLPWLTASTILLVKYGSHAYGTAIATSDEDFRGVAIPPREYFDGFVHVFEQADCKDPDLAIFDLRKFMRLAADCNPNIIEMLFTDPSDVLHATPLGERLLEHRRAFLSLKAKHTYSGYAIQQLRRIRTHNRWLRHPPTAAPTRADFDLPERTTIPADQQAAAQAAVAKVVDRWNLHDLEDIDPATRIAIKQRLGDVLGEMGIGLDEQWRGAAVSLGFDDNFIHLLDRERQYGGRRKEWEQYQNWLKTRNPARAALEAQHGYDTKHGLHLVRLLRMCREILTTGEVIVRRPDAAELLEIRAGAWSFERLVEWAEREDAELEALARESKALPKSPDRHALDRLCIELVTSARTP